MAFVNSPLPQEEQNQFSGQGQTTPNPLQNLPPQAGGSAGQGGNGAPSGGGTPGVGTPTQFGSNASKLSDYLTANQDQVQGMANQIAGNIGTQYNTVKGGIDQAGQQFGQQVQNSYTPNDPTLLQQVKDNPVQAASNPGNVSSFQKLLNDTYSGPSSFEGSQQYGGVQQKVTDAMQQAKLLGTYPGLSAYLQSNVETNPTPGQNTLDTALLQSSQPAFQTVQSAAAPFAGLQDYLTQLSGSQNQMVQRAQQEAPAAQQAAQSTLQGLTQPLIQNLNTGYQTAFDKAQQYNTGLNNVAQKIGNSNFSGLTPDEQKMIGYNPALTQFMQDYPTILPAQAAQNPINFSQYFTQGDQAKTPTPANTVTPDQLAQYQALTTLSGNAPQGLNFQLPQELQGPVGLGGQLPAYNNQQAGQAIQQSYQNIYDQLRNNNWGSVSPADRQKIEGYMTSLNKFLSNGQPSPQPTSPEPPPGSPGDLGSGFHWDPDTGSWQPTIPMQPGGPGGGQSGGETPGGGHVWF